MRISVPILALVLVAPSKSVAQVPTSEVRVTGSAAIVAVLLLAPTLLLGGQDSASRSTPGPWSLAVGFPSGGGGLLGLWWMPSRRVNLGLTIGLNVSETNGETRAADGSLSDQADATNVSIQLEPTARLYLARVKSVAALAPMMLSVLPAVPD